MSRDRKVIFFEKNELMLFVSAEAVTKPGIKEALQILQGGIWAYIQKMVLIYMLKMVPLLLILFTIDSQRISDETSAFRTLTGAAERAS